MGLTVVSQLRARRQLPMVEERHTQRRTRNAQENKLNKRAWTGEYGAARIRGGGAVCVLKRQHAGEDVQAGCISNWDKSGT